MKARVTPEDGLMLHRIASQRFSVKGNAPDITVLRGNAGGFDSQGSFRVMEDQFLVLGRADHVFRITVGHRVQSHRIPDIPVRHLTGVIVAADALR